MTLRSTGMAVLGAAALGVVSICQLCPDVAVSGGLPRLVTAALAAPAAEPKKVTLRVQGMTCGGCVLGTRKVLERLPGVSKAEVSYPEGTAVVTYDPEKVTVEQMVAAVKKLGYTASLLEPEPVRPPAHPPEA